MPWKRGKNRSMREIKGARRGGLIREGDLSKDLREKRGLAKSLSWARVLKAEGLATGIIPNFWPEKLEGCCIELGSWFVDEEDWQ